MPKNTNIISVSGTATSFPLFSSEKIIFREHPHLLVSISFIIFILLGGGLFYWICVHFKILNLLTFLSLFAFTLIFILIFGSIVFIIYLQWKNTEYILTNKRVEWRFGILGQAIISINLTNIENLNILYSLLGRIFNFGNIKIEPAGITSTINFVNLKSPESRKIQIEEAIG